MNRDKQQDEKQQGNSESEPESGEKSDDPITRGKTKPDGSAGRSVGQLGRSRLVRGLN